MDTQLTQDEHGEVLLFVSRSGARAAAAAKEEGVHVRVIQSHENRVGIEKGKGSGDEVIRFR
jgi:uncharacterized HAD superfamily protein